MARGWIKIHRSLFDHPVWANSTPEHKVILMTILGTVNHSPNKWIWKGDEYVVQPGQVVTSLDSLADKSGKGVTRQNVRTALKNFAKLKFLTHESTNKNSLISVVNWGIYQGKDEQASTQANQHLTDSQPIPNQHLTPIEEGKNVEEGNNDNSLSGKKPKGKVKPTQSPELEDFTFSESSLKKIKELGLTEDQARSKAEDCFEFHKGKGNLRADWQATFRMWIKKDAEYRSNQPQNKAGMNSNWDNAG